MTIEYDDAGNKTVHAETSEQQAKRRSLEQEARLGELEMELHAMQLKLDNLAQFVREHYRDEQREKAETARGETP